jgi:hypothetical protein
VIKIIRTSVIQIGDTHYGVMWINDKFLGVFKYTCFEDFKEWICPWRKPGKWRLFFKGEYVGLFNNEEDAATVYNFLAAESFGEFSYFNSVPQPWLE